MELFGTVNRILDGVGVFLGSPNALEADSRVSLDRLRFKRGKGLDSVAISMADIARPIMMETLIEVREAKKDNRAKSTREATAVCP
jgi:hypothetical protein